MPKTTPQNPLQNLRQETPQLPFLAKILIKEVMERHEQLHVLVAQIESELKDVEEEDTGDVYTARKLAQITSDWMGNIESMIRLETCINGVKA